MSKNDKKSADSSAFTWISNEPARSAYVTVDKQLRLYLNAGARDVLGVSVPCRLIAGYDYVNKRIVLAKPEVVRAANVKAYSFDQRAYAHARNFVRKIEVSNPALPIRFNYIGRDYSEYPDGSYAFEYEDYDAPDGGVDEE